MSPKRAATLVVAALLVLTGCSVGDTDADVPPTGGDTGTATAQSDSVDLSFTSETLDGSSFAGESLAGKPAVLWFWAPWCPTCRAQAPAVSRLAQQYDGRVNVVSVGGLGDARDIRDFAAQVTGPIHLVDEEGEVWRHLGVTAQSTYLVLDADGGVVAQGYLDDHVLADTVDELVG
jgi:thiol-disulfide isomerase/thioredoxin